MKILITGATGSVGNALGRALASLGHELFIITRSKQKATHYLEFPAHVIEHDLVTSPLKEKDIDGIEAIVHLMGETVNGRWNENKKKLILESRKKSSENLVKHLPPSVHTVISASGQGIYGDQGSEKLSETAKLSDDFLARVCKDWESPFQKLPSQIRTVQLRISLVLDPQSGGLKKMIPLFQRGLGGELSSGKQFMSWIALDDLVSIIVSSLTDEKFKGAINCATDHAVTNKEWTKQLGQALGAIPSPPVPELALRLALGEMADVVLASIRLEPAQLKKLGFKFKYETLEQYFQDYLKDFANGCSVYCSRQYVSQPIDSVFNFFSEARNLEKITPDFLRFHIDRVSTEQMQKGTEIDYRLHIKGVPVKWKTLIEEWQPPYRFIDTQLKGPYKVWHHTHSFETLGGGTLLTDYVRYKLPMGLLGRMAAGAFVQKDVEQIFRYRREVIHHMKF